MVTSNMQVIFFAMDEIDVFIFEIFGGVSNIYTLQGF
jgi:hypothetical protein